MPGRIIEVQEPGALTTLQDLGRTTGRKYGVPPGGAMDRYALQAANKLVGNRPDAAALEITLQGPRLLFESNALVAVTGAEFELEVDRRSRPAWMSLFVRAGQTLEFKTRRQGARAYLAADGGFAAPPVMGSRSTYSRAQLGGYQGLGRSLQAGDRLELDAGSLVRPALAAGRAWDDPAGRPAYSPDVVVRVIPGPFQEYFHSEAYDTLYNTVYRVGGASDRMGLRLEGAALRFNFKDVEVAPYGAVFGAIQVPPDGLPIILMADHQVTGGYPLVAVVLSADLPLLAQLLPGDRVRFRPAADYLIPGRPLIT